MKTVLLIGPPGSGKTTMIGLTAPRRPVHFVDIDRKIKAMESLRNDSDITSWDLSETLSEDSLVSRVARIADNKKPLKPPLGWTRFAEMVDRLDKDPIALEAGTWVVDSTTQLVTHLKNIILFHSGSGGSVMSPREWGYFLSMWSETITTLRDAAIKHDKDLMLTVHERVSEIPNRSTKLTHEKVGTAVERVFLGSMDMKIAPSIDGQFGLLMASYFEEVYALRVEMSEGKPKWICRVKPDGLRDLRTSFVVDREEFPPDFRIIWKGGIFSRNAPITKPQTGGLQNA